ncbi:protein disulfide oxidoreductase [Acidaminobacter hydrogenoformans]|uniref:Glutaredoxin-like domain protein n=1 Tax=Acidaminobacter hydrogenoformans DSM 2784 TaxID=1120920 RepID=A0A1G5RXF7_9FIRM|nr:thioredoxin family protein [Acidaminobacter hydrogenoformans]SCZ78141.1 Glutaredoxin-like domain protein [Acidaminobacter hydrogenoformans DSM 2784]
MKMFDAELEKQLKDIFNDLAGDVTIALFTEGDCYSCTETRSYMQEVSELNDKIKFVEYDLKKDADKAADYGVELVPSIVLLDGKGDYKRIKFNGIPAGHEINSLIPALMEVSGAESEMPQELTNRIEAIQKPIDIKVFVTLSCPHCPGAVQKAHKLALMNPNIRAEMIEAQTFAEFSDKYNVSGVPKIIINEEHELVGNQPLQAFLDTIESIQ